MVSNLNLYLFAWNDILRFNRIDIYLANAIHIVCLRFSFSIIFQFDNNVESVVVKISMRIGLFHVFHELFIQFYKTIDSLLNIELHRNILVLFAFNGGLIFFSSVVNDSVIDSNSSKDFTYNNRSSACACFTLSNIERP